MFLATQTVLCYYNSPSRLIERTIYFWYPQTKLWNSGTSLPFNWIFFHNAHGYNFLKVKFSGYLYMCIYICVWIYIHFSVTLKKRLLLPFLLCSFLFVFIMLSFADSPPKSLICYLLPHLFSICWNLTSPKSMSCLYCVSSLSSMEYHSTKLFSLSHSNK